MTERLTHDVLILGVGLAGLRAALEVSRRMEGKANIGILMSCQAGREAQGCEAPAGYTGSPQGEHVVGG